MKIIKHIPEAHLSVAELDDGTRLTISADSLAAAVVAVHVCSSEKWHD